MFLHHRDQYITRQLQKFIIEAAHNSGGHFDEIRHFAEQTFFDDGFAADEGNGLFDLCNDGGLTLFPIEGDACFADEVEEFVCRGDFDLR